MHFFLGVDISFTQAVGMFLLLLGVISSVGVTQVMDIIKDILKGLGKWIHLT
ncbi:unnamed protein product [marine sediment metagenome]|uniref:Uncharacterized protein n=1 Tax=marine sediment metagenome TaxID=412755 RepID=X1RHH4_9ZZZZ